MAEKKFSGVDGSVASAEISADFEAAKTFDKVKVGKRGVYFRDGLRTRFIAYDRTERVFIRIQEVNGKLCCGSTTFAYFRLVFVVDGREYIDVISEKEDAMRAALEEIRACAPDVAIGYVPPAKSI